MRWTRRLHDFGNNYRGPLHKQVELSHTRGCDVVRGAYLSLDPSPLAYLFTLNGRKTMKINSRFPLIAGISGALVMLTTSPAWSSGVPLDIGNGILQAKGAAVSIPVTFTCELEEGRSTEKIEVHLQQQLNPKVQATGGGAAEVACTGLPQTIRITVIAAMKNDGFAFRSGDAVATLTIGDPPGEPFTEVIRLRN